MSAASIVAGAVEQLRESHLKTRDDLTKFVTKVRDNLNAQSLTDEERSALWNKLNTAYLERMQEMKR